MLNVVLNMISGNLFQLSAAFQIETRHLIRNGNQMTGFLYDMQHWAEIGY